jgi:hypothetical protein
VPPANNPIPFSSASRKLSYRGESIRQRFRLRTHRFGAGVRLCATDRSGKAADPENQGLRYSCVGKVSEEQIRGAVLDQPKSSLISEGLIKSVPEVISTYSNSRPEGVLVIRFV